MDVHPNNQRVGKPGCRMVWLLALSAKVFAYNSFLLLIGY